MGHQEAARDASMDGFWPSKSSYGARPFVPALKTCLLVYQSEERKITIGPACIRITYKSVQFEFSFPPTGKSKCPEGVNFGDGQNRQNSESIFEKTRVGFGSPYRIFHSTIWHGPRGKGFHGGSPGADFCIFVFCILGGVKKHENAR